jgi:hypothetical protein
MKFRLTKLLGRVALLSTISLSSIAAIASPGQQSKQVRKTIYIC